MNHNLQSDNVPMLIVGNKCDSNEPTAVSTNDAQRFADNHNMPLFETSAKDDEKCDHVEAIFLTLAHKINANKILFKSQEQQTVVKVASTTSSQEEEGGYCCF